MDDNLWIHKVDKKVFLDEWKSFSFSFFVVVVVFCFRENSKFQVNLQHTTFWPKLITFKQHFKRIKLQKLSHEINFWGKRKLEWNFHGMKIATVEFEFESNVCCAELYAALFLVVLKPVKSRVSSRKFQISPIEYR